MLAKLVEVVGPWTPLIFIVAVILMSLIGLCIACDPLVEVNYYYESQYTLPAPPL